MARLVLLPLQKTTLCISVAHVIHIAELNPDQPGAGTWLRLTAVDEYWSPLPVTEVVAYLTAASSANPLVPYTDVKGNTGYVGAKHIHEVRQDQQGNASLRYAYLGGVVMDIPTVVPFEEMVWRLNEA